MLQMIHNVLKFLHIVILSLLSLVYIKLSTVHTITCLSILEDSLLLSLSLVPSFPLSFSTDLNKGVRLEDILWFFLRLRGLPQFF